MGCTNSSQVAEPTIQQRPKPLLFQSSLSSPLATLNQPKSTSATTINKQNITEFHHGEHFLMGSLGNNQQVFAKVTLDSFNILKMTIPLGLTCYNFSTFIQLQPNQYFITGGINHDLTSITNKCGKYNALTHTVKELSQMNQARYTHSSIYISHRKTVYVLGGRYYGDDSDGILNHCEKYLVQENKWVELPPMNAKRCTCFTMLWKDSIYAFGGYTGPYERSTVIERMSHTQKQWVKLEVELYRGLQGAIMLSTKPNQVTIFGGLTNSGSTDSVVTINFEHESIISRKKLKTSRSLYKGFNKQDKLYILGGDQQMTSEIYHINGNDSPQQQIGNNNRQLTMGDMKDDFDSLTFSTSSVVASYEEQKDKLMENNVIEFAAQSDEVVYIFGTTEQPFICELNVSLPHAQFKPVSLKLKLYSYQGGIFINSNQIFLFGGIENDSCSIVTSDTFLFDLKTNQVQKLPSMNQNRYAFTYQLVKNQLNQPEYIYVFGGATSNAQGKLVFLSACERYDLSKNKWELISPLPKKLISPMSLIYNQNILLFGGTDSDNKKNTNIFHYQPNLNQWVTISTSLQFGIQGGSLIQISNNQFYIFGGLLQNGQSSGIWSLYFNQKTQNKKKEIDVVFHEKGQMSEKKCQHKIYKPKNQQFYVIFGGNKDPLSFYDQNLQEQKSDRLYNLKSMFESVLEEFNTKSLKGYLILSYNRSH